MLFLRGRWFYGSFANLMRKSICEMSPRGEREQRGEEKWFTLFTKQEKKWIKTTSTATKKDFTLQLMVCRYVCDNKKNYNIHFGQNQAAYRVITKLLIIMTIHIQVGSRNWQWYWNFFSSVYKKAGFYRYYKYKWSWINLCNFLPSIIKINQMFTYKNVNRKKLSNFSEKIILFTTLITFK